MGIWGIAERRGFLPLPANLNAVAQTGSCSEAGGTGPTPIRVAGRKKVRAVEHLHSALPTGRPSSLRRKRQRDSCFWKSLRGPRLLRPSKGRGRDRSQLLQPDAHCTGGKRLRRRTERSCRKLGQSVAVRFQLDSPATSVDSQRGLSLVT
ncbi:hypothetical protein MHYP_G00237970 [Metynnis hypsauchen]